MNEVLRRRLVGLAVLLFGLFVLSWFVPGGDGRGVEPGTPSTVVALGPGGGVEAAAAAAAPDQAPSAPAAAEPAPPPIADLSGDAKPAPESVRPVPPPAPAPAPAPAAKSAPRPLASTSTEPPAERHAPVQAARPAPQKAEAPKPAPAKPAAKPAALVVAGKAAAAQVGWWIQIGSYSDRSKAETILSLLRKVGYRGELTTIQGQKGLLNRVRLGTYPNEAAARAALPKIAHQGYPQARVVFEPAAH